VLPPTNTVVTQPRIQYAFSQPATAQLPIGIFFTNQTEVPIVSVALSSLTTGPSNIEIRGLLLTSHIVTNIDSGLISIYRIRRGLGTSGPLIWQSNVGVGVDPGETSAQQVNVLYVDNFTTTTPGTNVYQLTGQIASGVSTSDDRTRVNGPIVLAATLYPQ
jgi:hypothetical protein